MQRTISILTLKDVHRACGTRTHEVIIMERRECRQPHSLAKQLAKEAKRLRKEARLLPPGTAREALNRKARRAEIAAQTRREISNRNRQKALLMKQRKKHLEIAQHARECDQKLRKLERYQISIKAL